jgi:hypothetical protein
MILKGAVGLRLDADEGLNPPRRITLSRMERDPALDAVLGRREQRSRIWRIIAANAVLVAAVFTLGVWLFPG